MVPSSVNYYGLRTCLTINKSLIPKNYIASILVSPSIRHLTVKIYTTIIQICITPGTFPDLISLTRPKRVLSSGREGQGLATQPATRAPPERPDTLLVQGLTRPFTGTLFP